MGNTKGLKRENALSIIREVKRRGEMTKPGCALATGLTAVSAHNFINELVDRGVFVESGITSSNGGRKAALYRINPGFGHIVGVQLEREGVTVTVHDLAMNGIYRNETPCVPDNSARVLALIGEQINEAFVHTDIKKERCLGLGIAVPGKVNLQTGAIISLPDIPNWNGVPVEQSVENMAGIRAFAGNDSNARALSAKWQGAFGEEATAVLLNITVGVGTGIISSSRLFYGSHSYAGEIGHTTIDYNGPLCSCGNRGCIEALATDQAIVERVKRLHDPLIFGESHEMAITDVIRVAKDGGNRAVYEILRETAYFISIALDHVMKTYDPSIIILQNHWISEFPDLYYFMLENLFNRCPWARQDALTVVVDPVDRYSEGVAAYIVLDRLLTDPEDNPLLKTLNMPEE